MAAILSRPQIVVNAYWDGSGQSLGRTFAANSPSISIWHSTKIKSGVVDINWIKYIDGLVQENVTPVR